MQEKMAPEGFELMNLHKFFFTNNLLMHIKYFMNIENI
jgi:hypothetical protein